jgi:nucleoside-diphosphate-sugar epimerase
MSELPGLHILDPDDAPIDDVRTVLITGAAGNLGRKLRAAWAERYEIIAVDAKDDPDDPDLVVADLAEWDDRWVDLMDEADVVVHLAANPSEYATWEELYRPNMDAMANVLLAAATAGVERFVFASSNHAMGGYRQAAGLITEELPPSPGNPYGATKLMGERLGRSVAAAYGMTFLGLRIGWCQRGENRPETLPDDWSRSIWLSNRDFVQLLTRSVEAEIEPGSFVVVNGVSRNAGSRWSLAEAERVLGYVPEDGIEA